jgi:hypothetical protein
MGLPKGDYVKQTDMSAVLQLMQDMNNRMISYERKGITSSSSPAETSSQASFRNPNDNPFQPKAIMSRAWCNFCEENHDESTCEVKKNAKDKIFGKRSDATIVVLDWAQPDDVMVVNTINKSYPNQNKIDPPRTTSTPSTSSQGTDSQAVKTPNSQGTNFFFLPLNIISLINWIILKHMLLFWIWFPSRTTTTS